LSCRVERDAAADLVWATNGPDFYLLLRSRGYTPAQYADFIRDVWTRTLLART